MFTTDYGTEGYRFESCVVYYAIIRDVNHYATTLNALWRFAFLPQV
jgi:hypothetical protein